MSGQGFGKSVDPPAASQTTTPGTVGEKEASEGRGSGDGGEGGGDAQKGVVSWEKEYKVLCREMLSSWFSDEVVHRRRKIAVHLTSLARWRAQHVTFGSGILLVKRTF